MLGNRVTKVGVTFAAAVLLGVISPRYAGALIQIDNTGTANFQNGAGTAQPAVSGVGTFYRQSNPVLAVEKKIWDDVAHTTDLTGTNIAIGTPIVYEITITYPRIADVALVCGDDSIAQAIVLSDAIPTQVTYTAGTLALSENGGAFVGLSDAADADAGEVVAGTVTVRPSDMNEGDGDAACTAANTRVIRIEGVVNAL